MKKLRLVSLVGITSIALARSGWAAPHGGGGGGFGGGGFTGSGRGGSVQGGGVPSHEGGVGVGRPAFSGRPAYYYSRGMHYTNSRIGQVRSPIHQSPSVSGPAPRGNNPAARQTRTSGRLAFNAHIAERHQQNWHGAWDRRHAHFFHNRFFVFIDGVWCGLDDGFFPWDYYPYYAYDYYPYDYYPGYYADAEPYYYNENVYSNTPMVDPTVTTVQKELTQLGYYAGPIDGIYGPTTRDAVAKYQIDKQLDVTGSLSAQTLQSFGLRQPTAS
jgi:hypothetical protein